MKRVQLAAIIFAAMTVAAFAERRVALVFSADNYKTVRPLKNAGNDGLAMKAALEALDFEVFLETDRDLRRMRRARVAQGNLPGALEAYQASLDIGARLAETDPSNAGWQRDLSVNHNNIGNVRRAQGNLIGALEAYQTSHAIAARLAAADPGNAEWQRDLLVSHYNVAQAGGDAKLHLGKALELAEELEQTGRLAPSDSSLPAFFRQEIRKLELAAK